jgi:hypothetical protein
MSDVDLYELVLSVRSRADFVGFLRALYDELVENVRKGYAIDGLPNGEWAHLELDEFFETWAAWLDDLSEESPQWERFGKPLDSLDSEAWRLFAEMLLVARVHE